MIEDRGEEAEGEAAAAVVDTSTTAREDTEVQNFSLDSYE